MRKKLLYSAAALLTAFAIIFCLYCSISFEITLSTDGNGVLYTEKTRVHPFSTVEIRIEPDGQYVLNTVTVNGEDKTDGVHFQTLRFRCIWGDLAVCATFREENSAVRSSDAAIFV